MAEESLLNGVTQSETRLGEGGFGVVYLGLWRGEDVAIKRFHPHKMGFDKHTGKPSQAFQRFIAEHDTLRPISHPSIVRVFGWTGPDTERGSPGLVMEYLPTTLRERYDMEPSLNFSQHVVVMKSVASGLEYLHSRGVIHRDLTTSNIMTTTDAGSDQEDGHCKITDVGLARCLSDSSKEVQTMTATPGMERYMAPETQDDIGEGYAKYGAKADIYTLGIAVMAMINKREPPNVFVLAHHGRKDDIKDIPRDHPLRPFVMQCIADNPDERPCASNLCSDLP